MIKLAIIIGLAVLAWHQAKSTGSTQKKRSWLNEAWYCITGTHF